MGTTKTLEPLKELSFDLPQIIDSTQITSFRSCPYKFFLQYCNHLRGGEGTPLALHAGGTFAAGLEAFRHHAYTHHHQPDYAFEFAVQAMTLKWGDYEEDPDSKDPRTFDRVCNAIREYFKRWPTWTDPIKPIMHGPRENPSFEFSFALPLEESDGFPLHPSGDPFIMSGRADLLGDFDLGSGVSLPVLEDDKTTTRLGPTWVDQWMFRHQFMNYCWMLRKMGYPHRHVIVRGIGIKTREIELVETPPIHYPDHVLDKFERELRQTLWNMIEHAEASKREGESLFDRNFGDACMSYFRPCAFTSLCKATPQNEVGFMKTLPREQWEPLGTERVHDKVPARPRPVLDITKPGVKEESLDDL